MRTLRLFTPAILISLPILVLGIHALGLNAVPLDSPGIAQASHAGGMDVMSIDMDPTGNVIGLPEPSSPATICSNTLDNDGDGFINDGCAQVGAVSESGAQCANAINDDSPDDSRVNDGCPTELPSSVVTPPQTCARINENGIQDADEDNIDTLLVDITAFNIPVSNRMIGYAFSLAFPDTAVQVATEDGSALLGFLPGSSLTGGLSDVVPDGTSPWTATGTDTGANPATSESGSGVLHRIEIESKPAAVAGVFPLTLSGHAHVDTSGTGRTPDVTNDALVAVDTTCPLPPVDIELVSLSLTSVNPIEPAGTNFALTVQATADNNGPNPADIRFDLGIAAPGDCTLTPPGNQTEDFLNVLAAESRTSSQVWTANCSTPSAHAFSGSGTVSVIGLAEETTPLNNGPVTDPEAVGITGDADVKVTNVVVDAPPDAATGAPFTVNVSANVHNNGPVDPVNADTTLDLTMPAGCSRLPDNPQAINDTSLALSILTPVQASWTVSCNTTGLKTFTGTTNADIDQLHTTDPNLANNSGQAQDTTDTSLGVADVKVTSVTVASPTSSPVNTNFPVTVSTTVHNNGPFFPVNADITLTLNLPADCFTPVTTIVFQDASLGPSLAAQLPDLTFFVACINHSFHNITATATISIDDPLAGDPNPGNNVLTSTAATTAIISTVDFKAIGVTLGTPLGANAGIPFNVTVDSILHNNGPDSGPADVAVSLLLPADCTTPVNPLLLSINLPVSVATPIPTQTFPVTCTGESFHDFSATVAVAAPLHIVDTNALNDSGASTVGTVAVVGLSDLKIPAVSASGPPSASVGVPFNVSSTTTVHNNGPFGPTNGDATVTLSLPADCSTPDPNPQVFTNVSLPVSTNASSVANWNVTCTDKSAHSFTANASVAVNQNHVDDPTPGNNAATWAPAVVAVTAAADGKIISATVESPPMFIASNTNVPITVRTVIHNNGPFGPATFALSRSIAPMAGCTVTPPATSNHSLAISTPVTVDAIWTINCLPGTHTFNFSNTLAVNDVHVADPTAGNNLGVASVTISVDTDGDGIADDVEIACGSNPLNGSSIPERIDGVYAGADDDLDTAIDEALPAGATNFDCDRDGYSGSAENHVYNPNTLGDQDPCGSNTVPPTVPATPIGWPADLQGGGIPDSTNNVNVLDLTSFLAPVAYLNSNVGSNPGDRRWDLVPGAGFFAFTINVEDLINLIIVAPPMIGGVRAFNGPSCPFPP